MNNQFVGHDELPKLLIVDIADALGRMERLQKKHLVVTNLDAFLKVLVSYLNKPPMANGCLKTTIDHLVQEYITPQYYDQLIMGGTPEMSQVARETILEVTLLCGFIFRRHGLYVQERLPYVYRGRHGTTKIILAKRPIPVY